MKFFAFKQSGGWAKEFSYMDGSTVKHLDEV